MYLITIDRDSGRPLGRQIVESVIEGIEAGHLGPGDPLPATRRLASELGVSRFTAEQAYEELWAEGYVEARQGSATRVRMRPPAARPAASGPSTGSPEAFLRPGLEEVLGSAYEASRPPRALKPGDLDFGRFNLDPRLYPVADFRRALDRVLARDPAEALSYGPPEGNARLRTAIARRMTEHGVATGPEGVVITDGALHGLDLAFRLLLSPGGSFLCEAPTFPGALVLGRVSGLRALGVAMDGEGIVVKDLVAACDREVAEGRPAPSVLYTMPSFHNPTGSLQGQARREAVLAACSRRNIVVVEDCFEEELGFSGKRAKPLSAMDGEGRVIYAGSFSKVLFPGVRAGWLATTPAFAGRLARLRAATGVAGNSLSQAALAEFMESGAYEAHVRRLNRAFARRFGKAVEVFGREVPAALARLRLPAGGYLLWAELLPGRGLSGRAAGKVEARAVKACAEAGLVVAPGSPFWPGEVGGPCLRLSIAGRDEAEIEEGLGRLGRALRRELSGIA